MPASGILEQEPCFLKDAQPIAAHFEAGGIAVSTGVSFDDYHRMQLRSKKSGHAMQLIPDWCFDEKKFREVIVTLVERRAGLKPVKGTYAERMERAQIALDATRPRKIALLEKYLFFWRANGHDPAYRRRLENTIFSIDRELDRKSVV